MGSRLEKRSTNCAQRCSIKSSPNATLNQLSVSIQRGSWATAVEICMEESKISFQICTMMLREGRKDKIKYILLVLKANAHSSQTLTWRNMLPMYTATIKVEMEGLPSTTGYQIALLTGVEKGRRRGKTTVCLTLRLVSHFSSLKLEGPPNK